MAYTVRSDTRKLLSELPFHAVGGQPAFEPDALERFVAQPRIATLAYLRADHRPHQTPIWYTYAEGEFLMTTVSASPKHRALVRDPRVSLTISDDAAPYRAVILEGAVELAPLDPADDPTSGMAARYFGRLGAREYGKLTAALYEESGQTLISFRPTVVRGFDNTRAVGRSALTFMRLRERLPGALRHLV